jgi:hypothetical protein
VTLRVTISLPELHVSNTYRKARLLAGHEDARLVDIYVDPDTKNRVARESIALSDVVVIDQERFATDSFALSDITALGVTHPVSETTQLTDTVLKGHDFFFTDTIGLTDVASLVSAQTLSESSAVSIADNFSALVSKPLGDSFTFGDSISFSFSYDRTYSDSFSFNDSTAISSSLVLPGDTVGMADSVTISHGPATSSVFNNTTFNTSALGA